MAREVQETRELKAHPHLHYTRRVLGANEHVLDPLAMKIEGKTNAYKQKRREILVANDIG